MRRALLPGIAIAAAALGGALILAERPWRSPAWLDRPGVVGHAPPSEPELAPGPRWPWARGAPATPEARTEPGEISIVTLLDEMADLGHLARLPSPPFRTTQTSSYDRRSRTPADPAGWFANDDFITNDKPNLVRVETVTDGGSTGKRYVLLDAVGPGAVVRIWTATPTGTLRVHIDDDPTPALEAPMGQLLSGTLPPFEPPFGQVTSMGHTLYFPLPYRRHCVVTLDSIISTDPFSGRPVDRVYYQIGVRTYRPEASAHVRPFSWAEMDRARATIARVGAALKAAASGAPGPAPVPAGRGTVTTLPRQALTAGRGITATIAAPRGGGSATELRLWTSERDPERLRATILSLTFDGENTVRVPLVDFFGTGWGWNPYRSLPLSVEADGTLQSRFPMPFHGQARIDLSYDGPGSVEVGGTLAVEPRPFDEASLLFHARRRPQETFPTRPFRDWHLGTLSGGAAGNHSGEGKGGGQLVGAVLDVENPVQAMWWGEGDEKIFVDGEPFPGIFGTGTEDYFGYAWSSTQTFAHPYHAQTRATGPGFAGQFSMNRFHVLDPIPFASTLRFDLEAWHWSDTTMPLGATTMSLAATLYWYARPHGGDDFPRP